MDRKTRICIWIIVLGLVNFLAYAIAYDFLDGEAIHGGVRAERQDGKNVLRYYLFDRGHRVETARAVWIYSAVHSISIWITVGAVLLAMLTLAKEHIVSSMHGSVLRGRTFITILATVVTLISVVMTVRFALYMIGELTNPGPVGAP